jgi:hypothetical protein
MASEAPTKGVAEIKPEFRAPRAASEEGTVGTKRPASDDAPPTNGEESSAQSGRQRQRGMNKQRKFYKPEKPEMKLCAAVLDKRECKFGDGCRFTTLFPS